MRIIKTTTWLEVTLDEGPHRMFGVRFNVSDNILEAVDVTGKTWASAATIEKLQKALCGLEFEAKDLGDEDVNRDGDDLRRVPSEKERP